MPTILDSNVVLDVISPSNSWTPWSRKWIERCSEEGAAVINSVILAEACARIVSYADVVTLLHSAGFSFEAIPMEASHLAGQLHYQYRRNSGSRERVLPDFLIGAHAAIRGYRILTRDQARYRAYFPSLDIIAPDSHP